MLRHAVSYRRFTLSLTSTMHNLATISIPRSDKQLTVPTGLFIDNEFVDSADSSELIQQVTNTLAFGILS